MSASYIHIKCGPHDFVLDIAHVVEVMDMPDDVDSGNSSYRLWRDRKLPVFRLAEYLGGVEKRTRNQVVVGEVDGDESLLILDVDEVCDLVELAEDQFVQVPEPSRKLEDLIDGVFVQPDEETCLLNMRFPFRWLESSSAGEIDPGTAGQAARS